MKTKIFITVGKHLKKRTPELLIGLGIAGMGGSVIFAVRATPKAIRLLDRRKKQLKTEKLPVGEILKTAGPCYIPSAISFAAATGMIIGAHTLSLRRQAAIAAAYSLSEGAFREYREKVLEEIGKNKEEKIRDGIAKDKIQKDPVENREVIITDKGKTLCYESISGRYFENSIDTMQKAVNELNRQMLSENFIPLNDFYYEIGLPQLKGTGDDLGWNIEKGFIDLRFSTQLAEDGRPCIVVQYSVPPQYDYQYFG